MPDPVWQNGVDWLCPQANYAELEAALRQRPAFRAVLDVWPGGCWNYPNASCGSPVGAHCFPASPSLVGLPNVLPLPGMSMRDAQYWQYSAEMVAANLDALSYGRPLKGVVRNATAV